MDDKKLLEKIIKKLADFIKHHNYFFSHLSKSDKKGLFLYFMTPFMGVDNTYQLKTVWKESISKLYRVMSKQISLKEHLKQEGYDKIFDVVLANKYRKSANKSKNTIYIICDATLGGKHYGINIDYASKRYDSSDNSYKITNEEVCFYCVIKNKVFFFDHKLWKSKDEEGYAPSTYLFMQMVEELEEEAQKRGLAINEIKIVVDGGFISKEILAFMNSKGLSIIGRATENSKGYSDQLGGIKTSFKILRNLDYDFKKLSKDDTEYVSLFIELAKTKVPLTVKLIICRLNEDTEKVSLLISNNVDLNSLQIIKAFRIRWKIERGFADLKSALLWENYHFHTKSYNAYPDGVKLTNHFSIKLILFDILQEIKLKYFKNRVTIFEMKDMLKGLIFNTQNVIDTMFSLLFSELRA